MTAAFRLAELMVAPFSSATNCWVGVSAVGFVWCLRTDFRDISANVHRILVVAAKSKVYFSGWNAPGVSFSPEPFSRRRRAPIN